MKLIKREFLLGKVGIVGLTLFTSFCVSCQSKSPQIETIQIQAPTQDHFTFTVDSDGYAFCPLPGFSYSGPLSTYDVEVHHTFFKGLMSMEASIVDINPTNETFSVLLLVTLGSVGEMTGTVSFSSINYDIEYTQNPIVINLQEESV